VISFLEQRINVQDVQKKEKMTGAMKAIPKQSSRNVSNSGSIVGLSTLLLVAP
jgi:hypothetical protein